MNAKNYFAGAALLAILINAPAAYADEPEFADEEYDAPFTDEDDDLIIITPDEDFVVEPPRSERILPPPNYSTGDRILPPSRINTPAETKTKKVKTQKARFVKLAADDMYTYYLDRESVSWKRVPYLANEYMADVWIRMVEHNVDTSELPQDLADYINDNASAEISLAQESGKPLNPVDVEVLQHKKYFLEHYYLRPKTKQIQFLCELEVVGHPQNTVSERQYEYKNWENLIPGSVESIIYKTVLKEIGTSKATERGHMTFVDMVEEYARISLR